MGRGKKACIHGETDPCRQIKQVLRNMGQGIGILVSKIPKETSASYSLREPSEVRTYLYSTMH
jgi:hypothetical protein